jgi:hypothetical protein
MQIYEQLHFLIAYFENFFRFEAENTFSNP